ncbi:MAG: hypothetical protein GY950_33015, partial [bacterium]|nr:hypothetical protein [bacterium]
MSSGLPLEILGMIGPILCWVEGGERPGLPDSWLQNSYSFCERIRGWLIRELPTYSYDSLDEIVTLAMDPRNPCGFPLHRRRSGKQMIPMAPPSGFNLIYMLHKLSSHYFQWVGNTLCVREDRIVELHELALRFPVRHLIRYCHADAVVRGYISMECAKELPVHMGRLHTTYQGLRTVVERGLCEGHLHLNGVINADEAWADHLLKRSSPGVQDGFTPEADRLLVLSRTAVRLLAIGMLYAHTGIGCRKLLPFHLINHLDRMYQARNPMEDRNARRGLNKKFIEVFNTLKEKGQPQGRQEDLRWLLVLANPGMNRLWFGSHVRDGGKDSVEPRGVRRRLALLRRLHLEVLKFLVERNVRTAFIDPALEQCGAIGNTVKEK